MGWGVGGYGGVGGRVGWEVGWGGGLSTQILLYYRKFIKIYGINICVFDAKPCSRGLIFAVSSGLVNYLLVYRHGLCLRVFIFVI